MKTIKQVADELGVSKDIVRYRVGKLPGNYLVKAENITYLTDEGVTVLKGLLVGNQVGNYPGKSGGVTLLEILRNELEVKNTLIERQQTTIDTLTVALEHTTASLHAAQVLHAGTIQQQIADGDDTETAATGGKKTPGIFKRIFGQK